MSKTAILSVLASMLVSPAPETLETLTTDLTECPKDIAPFVVAIEVGEFKDKPSVADVEISIFDDNGKPKKVKPSADQRDQAWEFYTAQQTQASKENPEEKQEGKTPIKFIRPWRNYITGDITARPQLAAKSLIDKGFAVRYTPEESTDE